MRHRGHPKNRNREKFFGRLSPGPVVLSDSSGTRLDGTQTAAQGRGEGHGFGDKQRTCKQLKNKNGLGEE